LGRGSTKAQARGIAVKRVKASKKAQSKRISESSNWIKFVLPIGIFILAFLVRFIYLIQIESSLPFFSAPIMDELRHDSWAQQIASGEWVGTEPFFRAPLYMYLLALTYKIFGHSFFLPRLLQMILGSLSCVLIFLIAKKLFNRTIGILSGIIASFYALLIFYDGQLLITSLVVFLDLALLGLLILTAERPKVLNWFFCGIVLGLSAIARPSILVFVPFILIWMIFGFKNKRFTKTILMRWAILCVGVLLMIAPVTLRNYLVGKDFVLIAWNGGYNFYLGNNPDANGWSATAPQIDKTWWGGYKEAIWLAEKETGQKLKPSQISDFWYKKGAFFILSRPLSWLKLMAKKTIYFWKGFEISNNQNIYLYKDFSSLLDFLLGKGIIYLPFGLVGPFSILGLLICLRDLRKYLLLYLFILSYSASIIIFFVCSRYRLPVISVLIMFGSFFIWWIFQKAKNKEIPKLVISVSLTAVLLVTLNTRLESLVGYQRFTDHYVLGVSYESMGKLEMAIEEYKTSLRYNPKFPDSRNNLAILYTQLGKTDLAEKEFKRTILSDPSYEKSYYNLATLYHKKGELDLAIEYYLKAIRVNPRYEFARLSLGKAYSRKGLGEEAKEEWRKVLELNPGNKEAKKLLKRK
jgi:tetratricopeptide (TPR) repeat protein